MDTDFPPPADEAAAPDADALASQRARDRRIIVISGVLTVLVMAAVVVVAWQTRDGHAWGDGGTGHAGGGNQGPPNAPWLPVDDQCPRDSERPPKLVFDLPPTGVHFGEVKQGLVLERDVEFRNEGTGRLCIPRVDSGCGCIKARLVDDKRRYEPGEGGRIKIVVDTKGREGVLTKTITLYTNAVDVPLQRFVVRATVNQGLRYSPALLHFGRVVVGQPAETRLTLRAPLTDGEWEVVSVAGTRPEGDEVVAYTWRTEVRSDPRDRIIDLFVTHPGAKHVSRGGSDTVVIRTTHPNRPEFTVKTSLNVVDPITPQPLHAAFGFVPGKDPARIRLVRGSDAVEFEVTGHHFEQADGESIPTGTSGFRAEFSRERGEWWVMVAYDEKERDRGPVRAVLVVETDYERQPEVRINCRAVVQ